MVFGYMMFWFRFEVCVAVISGMKLRVACVALPRNQMHQGQRTVFRLTLVRDWNMNEVFLQPSWCRVSG